MEAEVLLWYVLLCLGCFFLLIITYLCFLALVSFWPLKDQKSDYSFLNKFIILVPAHNESKVIKRTIDSLSNLDYPRDKYETIVIVDNCTDNTAQIVRGNDVICFERVENRDTGKGAAVRWGIGKIKGEEYDAVVIIDADTVVDTNFLRVINKLLCEGEVAIQGYYDVLDPEKSIMASLSYLGFVLSRNLRYRGRSRLGWSSNLLGNGMCFSRQVLEKFAWSKTSIVEDLEYEMRLVLNGIRVAFAPHAKVYAEIPDNFADSKDQRQRWDLGKFHVRNKYLPRLISEGIRKRQLSYLDCALELLIPPYSLFCTLVTVLFLLVVATSWGNLDLLFFLWVGIMVLLILYSLLGLIVAKAGWRIYKNLLYVPFFLFWRFTIILRGYFSGAGKEWVKTKR